jgi:lactoylglutathione lyase
MDIVITRVDHLGIRVADAERSERFYDQLGFSKVAQPRREIVILRNLAGVEINLVVNADPAFDGTNALMDDGVPKRAGYTHVALRVVSLDETVQALGERGVEITEGPVHLGGRRSLFVRDPDRNVIELREG